MSIIIALAGNPNCGKTTLFNALTGSNQFVGNWPGVTVEKKEGRLKGNKDVIVTDLPGIYSLSPYTLEEVVARNYLLEERPDVILNIIDGTNLERNLYLTTQLLELGIPMVAAVNMLDVMKKNGDKLDLAMLQELLGCQVVEISALKGIGIKEAASIAINTAENKIAPSILLRFQSCVEKTLTVIGNHLLTNINKNQHRWFAIKIFEGDEEVRLRLHKNMELAAEIQNSIEICENERKEDAESIITNQRYQWITQIIKKCLKKQYQGNLSKSDKIDRIVTNRWLALPIFAMVMFVIYFVSVTTIGGYLTDWANDILFGSWIIPAAQSGLDAIQCASWLSGLIVNGILSGVGAVLGFVPQMMVLFIFLAFLEACGYMARIAFIMDRIFRKFGLSGKSFIPMLIGSGCGVPAIMASRTIENERDRKMTIMTTTFIPCGAKLPIIALIAGALFNGAPWVAPSAYFVGIAAIISSGIILKKTKMFMGPPTPFVIELPPYRMPTIINVLRSTWERGWSFIKKAGTIILLSTIFIWFTESFGFSKDFSGVVRFQMVEDMNDSMLATIGNIIAPFFSPLGWGNWKSAVAAITGLVAKENVVGTFGILFGFSEVAENGNEIWGAFANSMTPVAAYSFLVFNLLCAPCFAAMGAIKREMNNTRWFWFAIGYQTFLAYCIALCVYQVGTLVVGGRFGILTAVAFLLILLFLYMLFRPSKENNRNSIQMMKGVSLWERG